MSRSNIIPYSNTYFSELMELNKSLTPKWYHYKLNKKQKVGNWDDLTPKERFKHGGPWNDPECLKVHLKEVLKIGSLDLLIDEETGELLGEIEYHQFQQSFHIDWMMIHPRYQKKELGTKLLNYLISKGNKKGLHSIWTEPEKGVEKFYIKSGFKIIKPSYFRYKINGRKDRKSQQWTDEIPEFDGFIYGEASNDHLYLQLLINSSISFAEIFGSEFPIRYTTENNTLFVRRNIPSLFNKNSLFFITEEQIDESKAEEKLSGILSKIPKKIQIYTTFLGDVINSWSIFGKIYRLKINLQQEL